MRPRHWPDKCRWPMARTGALLLLSLFAISGCAQDMATPLYLPHPLMDPSDVKLRAVMDDYLLMTGSPRQSEYDYARIDMNGDGRRDALVLFNLPHHHWCGWGGCTLVVFEAQDDHFSVISRIANVRGPLLISPKTSHGWNDIILRLTGMNRSDETIRLAFDGRSYPADPSTVPPISYDFEDIVGARLFP